MDLSLLDEVFPIFCEIFSTFLNLNKLLFSEKSIEKLNNLLINFNYENISLGILNFLYNYCIFLNLKNSNLNHKIENGKNIFIFSEFPIIHYDLLFKSYLKTNDLNLKSISEKYLLNFYPNLKKLRLKYYDFLYELTEQNLNNREKELIRILDFIHHFIFNSEKNFLFDDYVPKLHISPLNQREFIQLRIKFDDLDVSISSNFEETISILKTRLGYKFSIPPNTINLYFDNNYLLDSYTIQHYKISNNNTIILKQHLYGSFSEPCIQLLSSHLYQKQFTNKLIEILQENANPNLQLSVYNLFFHFPQDNGLFELLSNPEFFLKKLFESKNDALHTYMLHILMNNVKDDDINNLLQNNIIQLYLNFLQKRPMSPTLESAWIYFFDNYFNLIFIEFSIPFFKYLFIHIEKKINLGDSFFKIIFKFINLNPQFSLSIIEENLISFNIIISSCSTNITNKLRESIKLLPNLTNILNDCISNSFNGSLNHLNILIDSIFEYSSSLNLKKLFEKCLILIKENNNGNIINSICLLSSKLLQIDSTLVQLDSNLGIDTFKSFLLNPNYNSLLEMSKTFFKVSSEENLNNINDFLNNLFNETKIDSISKTDSNFEKLDNYSGIKNLGATCYLNSIFQQL